MEVLRKPSPIASRCRICGACSCLLLLLATETSSSQPERKEAGSCFAPGALWGLQSAEEGEV
eukprot:760896-Hanusia_phi.AAC.3